MRAVAACVTLIALVVATWWVLTPHPTVQLPGATVKVIPDVGHGSGVHIGGGYILTAAHVVTSRNIELKLDDGSHQPAHVLWTSPFHDVALLLTDPSMGHAPLRCDIPVPGADIKLSGNPIDLEFISTFGRVAGEMSGVTVPVSATIVMGMSGGPVFDNRDRVVGISVAVTVAFGSLTGIGHIVPGRIICELLGRS